MTTATTTTEKAKTPRAKRTSVPAPAAPGPSTSVVDALGSTDGRARHAEVPLDLIDPDPRNPEHRYVDLDDDFAASIQRDGVLTPVMLRPNTTVPGRWWLVAGARRCAHARHVGLAVVPATLLPERTDLEALRTLLIENTQRLDLAPSEEGALVQGLLDLGVDAAALPGEVHKSSSWVKARRAVAHLPESTRARVDTREVTLGDVVAVEEYSDDPEIYASLVRALDTGRTMTWELERAKTTRKDKATMVKLAEAFGKLAVPVVKDSSKKVRLDGLTPTHGRVGAIGPDARQRYYKATSAKDLKALAAQYPDLVAVESSSTYSRYYSLAVPAEDMPPAEQPAVDPEAEAREQLHAEALAACREDALTAFRLRCAFIVEFATGTRKLKPEHVAELASLAILEALNSGGWPHGVNDLRVWLEAAKRCDPKGALVDVERAYASLPAGVPLLLFLAHRVEGVRPDSGTPPWMFSGQPWLDGLRSQVDDHRPWSTPVPWYALLQRLGYRPSDHELAALSVPAAEGGASS